MREADAVAFQLDHPGGYRPVEPSGHLLRLGAGRRQRRRRRFGEECAGLEHAPDCLRQTLEPCTYDLVERSRNRERLCRTKGRPFLQEEAGDLERVEGIPARGVVHPAKRGARQRLAQARKDEPMERTQREWTHSDAERPVREVTPELDW